MRLSIVSIIVVISLCMSLIGNAGEIKERHVSPKVKIIREEEGKGANLRHQNKRIQFLDEKGNPKKEIDLSDNPMAQICVSVNAKRIIANSNIRWKYSEQDRKDFEQKKHKARGEGNILEQPKDYWGILQDIEIYDENGEEKQKIQVDVNIQNLYCTDNGEVVVSGRTQVDRTGERLGMLNLLFYDNEGKLVRRIDGKEAKEKNIAINGTGKIYQEDKVIWVGALGAPREGGAITLFDIRGNIIWQYKDIYFATNWPDIYISPKNNHIYVKGRYTDWDSKEEPIKKTWILDQNGNCVKVLDGWQNEDN